MLKKSYLDYVFRNFWVFHLSKVASIILYLGALFLSILGRHRKSIKLLLASIRYSYLESSSFLLFSKYGDFDFSSMLSRPAESIDALSRAIILSCPKFKDFQLEKKGVILITFSHTFSFFLLHHQWKNINKYFAFVLEPSWAGYADPDIMAFAQRADCCVIQASEIKDRVFLNRMFPHIPCDDTGASNWIDSDFFRPAQNISSEKEFDSIYVANLNPIKRVYRAIDVALGAVSQNQSYKMAVVCARWGGGNYDDLRYYIRKKGLVNNVILYEGLPQKNLISLIMKSKCSVLFSLKEGSNRVLFESMFLNVPVVCISENIGVNKSYINSKTGLLVPDNSVASALLFMSENFTCFSPRDWALNNISPEVSTLKLSETISNFFGDRVNSGLFVKVNRPEVFYKNLDVNNKSLLELIMESKTELEFIKSCNDVGRMLAKN